MAVNLTNADNALKTLYLDAISHQLDTSINPFFASIEKTTNDVWGKEIRKVCTYGVNGGIGAGTEDGALPKAVGNNYTQFVGTLKNLYGVIEISDKAIRASENNSGAFVSLLNSEMEGLIEASKFNFGRMLFGDGSGCLSKIDYFFEGKFYVDDIQNFAEGMVVEVRDDSGNILDGIEGYRIKQLDKIEKYVRLEGLEMADKQYERQAMFVLQGSYNKEISGLGKVFDLWGESLYGVNREDHVWMRPYFEFNAGDITELALQKALDGIEEQSGKSPNLIICTWGVRRALQQIFAQNRRMCDTVELAGGYKAMSYNGIPIVADKFCPQGTMYILNTDEFVLHQLCDWQWLADDDGRVLKQIPGKPVYTATLVKYAELICNRPSAQGIIAGINEI